MKIDWIAQPEVLEQVKQHLRIDDDADDGLLKGYVEAAMVHVEQHCDRTLVVAVPGVELPPEQMELTADVWQAVMLLVAHWYATREAVVTGTIATPVQLGFERLLWYRKRF